MKNEGSLLAVGIDVGTTNLNLSLVNLETREIVERRSTPVRRVPSDDPLAFLQDARQILSDVEAMLDSIPSPCSIGITGQVHGIVYTDEAGKPCSPLYSWLDRHGTEDLDGSTPQHLLEAKTGCSLPVGYGLLTHYANRLFKRVPAEARRITGINELVAGALTGRPLDRADSSDLACFGGFDPVSGVQDPRLLAEALPSPSPAFLTLAPPFTLAGTSRQGVPVAFPVGDNQAGFFGALAWPRETCLINIGTSGQISVFSEVPACPPDMELRPYLGLGYLCVGATLCAGKAYETLARLFREAVGRYMGTPADEEAIFGMMKSAAREAIEAAGLETSETKVSETKVPEIGTPGIPGLVFDTALNGTRHDPLRRGSVTGVTLDNFTMGNLVWASIEGIVRELADFRDSLGSRFDPVKAIVVAGSAVRKNELFARALSSRFNREIRVPRFDGGAALGAALIGAVAAEIITLEEAPVIIEGFWR
jgi:sedoheptulokinase